jgi:hypothetical protein
MNQQVFYSIDDLDIYTMLRDANGEMRPFAGDMEALRRLPKSNRIANYK